MAKTPFGSLQACSDSCDHLASSRGTGDVPSLPRCDLSSPPTKQKPPNHQPSSPQINQPPVVAAAAGDDLQAGRGCSEIPCSRGSSLPQNKSSKAPLAVVGGRRGGGGGGNDFPGKKCRWMAGSRGAWCTRAATNAYELTKLMKLLLPHAANNLFQGPARLNLRISVPATQGCEAEPRHNAAAASPHCGFQGSAGSGSGGGSRCTLGRRWGPAIISPEH